MGCDEGTKQATDDTCRSRWGDRRADRSARVGNPAGGVPATGETAGARTAPATRLDRARAATAVGSVGRNRTRVRRLRPDQDRTAPTGRRLARAGGTGPRGDRTGGLHGGRARVPRRPSGPGDDRVRPRGLYADGVRAVVSLLRVRDGRGGPDAVSNPGPTTVRPDGPRRRGVPRYRRWTCRAPGKGRVGTHSRPLTAGVAVGLVVSRLSPSSRTTPPPGGVLETNFRSAGGVRLGVHGRVPPPRASARRFRRRGRSFLSRAVELRV